MTALVNPVPSLNPPYYHREYSHDIRLDQQTFSNIYRRIALVVLPFLSLHKPLGLPISLGSFPLSLGMGATRMYTSAHQLISQVQSGDCHQMSLNALQTTIAVAALASTLFAHPLGMIITTAHDIMLELSNLIPSLQENDWETVLPSLTKTINHAFYLALICFGGLELAVASYIIQALSLVISSREEFKKGHFLEGYGNLLMTAVRIHEGYSQFKLLQRQWEIEKNIKRVFVGELHEKWQFPSDHLPVGIEVNGIKIISWNVLNNAYMEWVTTKDSQGLNGSMISDLDIVVKPNGLTQRDLIVVDEVVSMMKSGQVVALQECGMPFLEALKEKLPTHWHMVTSFTRPKKDQDVILFDTSKLMYHEDQSEVTINAYPSVPNRPIQNAFFSRVGEEQGKDLRIINAHIPGDPTLPVREEFAKYIHTMHQDGQITVALGDNNFEREEMILAYRRMGFARFSFHSPWKTNIDPYGKYSKAIDHLFVAGSDFSRDLTPDEVLRDGNLQETIALLNKERSSF